MWIYAGIILFLQLVGPLAQESPSCLCLEELESARGLRNPTVFKHAGDGSNRKFIAEQVGLVWIFQEDGSMLPTPFLNLTELVFMDGRYADEQGFLAMTFHPQFSTNRILYVYFNAMIDDDLVTVLAELKTDEDNQNQVDPTSLRILMEVFQIAWNHNGGDLIWMDDGTLLVMIGDGGVAGDPYDVAQDKTSFLGKILRIDVNTRTGNLEYGIPSDNPFLHEVANGTIPELYALGMRNPWRATIDPGDRTTGAGRGRVVIGDVGQNAWEEVDLLEAAGNYAWPSREGPECYKIAQCGNIGPEVWPIHYYNHSATGRCVIGGHFYRGCSNPDINGWYFFADYINGRMFRLTDETNPDGTWNNRELEMCATNICHSGLTNVYEPFILSWGTDEKGELYFTTTSNPTPSLRTGAVYRIVNPFENFPPCP